MLKKSLGFACALVLVLSCFLSPAAALEVEDDIDITDLVTVVEEETVREQKDSDGAFLMNVTCAGDFTIGKDMNHKDIFTPELEKNNGSARIKRFRSVNEIDINRLKDTQVLFAIGNIAGCGRDLIQFVKEKGEALV